MRTEQDLRRALAQREEIAPDPDRVLAGVRQAGARRRRRQKAAAVTGAACAVLLVAALPAVLSAVRRGSAPVAIAPPTATSAVVPPTATSAPAQGAARPPFSFTITRQSVAGFRIDPYTVNGDVQTARIARSGARHAQAELSVFQPGAEPVAADTWWDVGASAAVQVTVNGQPGTYSGSAEGSAIRWEYAPGAWAQIGTIQDQPSLPEQTMVTLAAGIRFVAPYPARVPYRLDYRPADLVPFNVVQDTARTGSFSSVLQLESRDETRPRIVDISIVDGASWPRKWPVTRTTIAGHPARCTRLVDGRRCAADFGAVTVDVGSASLTEAELKQLIAGVRLAVWTDPSTWSDVDTVFPS
jgi:hypothetical protein